MKSLEGHTLGEFEILERLGQGGMGAVYKARQLSLKRLVALKTLQAAVADDEAYIARFQQEAIAAAGLNHPNLVQVYSAGQSEGLYWFTMEYVEGESARARLKREGRIAPREALTIAICVATALQYGWRKASLIHRDIKPDNIFLSRDGEVKLGDLGLAKNAGETNGLTSTGHSLGTPYYISPEQAQDSKNVDFRADIYSLGCTLFHMVTGAPPFDGSSAAAIMLKHITEPVPILQQTWPQCPPLLSEVVGKMMQKDPADRQQDYETVIRDLRRAYAMPGTHPAPVRPGPPAGTAPTPAPAPPVGPGPSGPGHERGATYVLELDLEASALKDSAPALESEPASAADRDPPRASPIDVDLEAPTVPTPAPLPVRPGPTPQPQASAAGTGELKLVPEFNVDRELPTSAGPAPIPPWVSSGKPPSPNPPRKSRLPLAIAVAVVVVAALLYFTHHGKKSSTADTDDSTDPPTPESAWRDWVLESRRDGYFLYHREFLDQKPEVIFKQRASANSDVTFRNGHIRVYCIIPPPTLPEQCARFYVRQAPDAKGVLRRYEAYLTGDTVVFALNDGAQGVHEITHWSVTPTPDAPIAICMEIEARKNTFTVSLDKRVIGIVQDDTIPGAGTFGVDGPAGTLLSALSFATSDPPPATPPPAATPQPPAASPTTK